MNNLLARLYGVGARDRTTDYHKFQTEHCARHCEVLIVECRQ